MPTCERCWADAQSPYFKAEDYFDLVAKRNAKGEICTPEQQAGPDASECIVCNRMTLHQHCHICMNSECQSKGIK